MNCPCDCGMCQGDHHETCRGMTCEQLQAEYTKLASEYTKECPTCHEPVYNVRGAIAEMAKIASERDTLRAEVMDLRRVLGPYSTVEIAIKAWERMNLQIRELRAFMQNFAHYTSTFIATGPGEVTAKCNPNHCPRCMVEELLKKHDTNEKGQTNA